MKTSLSMKSAKMSVNRLNKKWLKENNHQRFILKMVCRSLGQEIAVLCVFHHHVGGGGVHPIQVATRAHRQWQRRERARYSLPRVYTQPGSFSRQSSARELPFKNIVTRFVEYEKNLCGEHGGLDRFRLDVDGAFFRVLVNIDMCTPAVFEHLLIFKIIRIVKHFFLITSNITSSRMSTSQLGSVSLVGSNMFDNL